MPEYRVIDMETWPRREHFMYYRERIACGYSMTASVDVTGLRRFSKEKGYRFYGCFLYAAAKTVNSLDHLRMMIPPEGGAGVWRESHPNFTVFHPENETFSDLWTEYREDFEDFYREFVRVTETYGDRTGIKGRPDQPQNFFCISCVPWLDYTAYSTYTPGPPALFPIITFGKYTEQDGRFRLPVTMTISHASADGYHTSKFFEVLQRELNALGEEEKNE